MSPDVAILLTATVTAIACALAGVFLVLRRMAMMADAMSHSILPGIVAGYVLAQGPNLVAGFVGATAAGLATVGLVEWIARKRAAAEDAAIGLVFPTLFAIGVIAITKWFSNVHLDADAVLFGEIAFVPFETVRIGGTDFGPQALWVSMAVAILNAGFLALGYSRLKAATFDPEHALAIGIRPAFAHAGLMTVVAITTVSAFSAVGAILSVALIVTPVAIGTLVTRRLPVLVAISPLIGASCAMLGYQLAAKLDVSISGMMATTLGALFLLALAFAPGRGFLATAARRRRQASEFALNTLLVHLHTHEGTQLEPEESAMSHLELELGWEPSKSQRLVHVGLASNMIVQESTCLKLTESGRARAAQLLET